MHDDHNFITQQVDRDKALLTIIKTGVFEGKCESLENTVSIGEVKIMLGQVGLPFFIVLSEFHIIGSICIAIHIVNGFGGCGRYGLG